MLDQTAPSTIASWRKELDTVPDTKRQMYVELLRLLFPGY
jgi:hypothetical protein